MYGEILKKLRIEKGLTQQQLAEILGFKSASAVGMVERQERELSFETIKRIVDFFNVSSDYLMGLVPFKNETEVKKVDSFDRGDGMSEDKQNDIINNQDSLEIKIKDIEALKDFEEPEDALKFILSQPMMAAYGGYDLKNMSHEEIIEIANDMLFAMRLSIEKLRKKNK